MGDAASLIEKYRGKGVFVDTNLLVLLLVGLVNPKRICNFKRTENFEIADFYRLQRLIDWFGPPIAATPHVLSQVSDLAKLSGPEFHKARELFKQLVTDIDECTFAAKELVHHELFHQFGLADASVATACEQHRLVLTADVLLYSSLTSRGPDAVNFNHVRALAW